MISLHTCRTPQGSYVLYNHRPFEGELLEVGFQGQVVVDRLHVGGEDLSTVGHVHASTHDIGVLVTHPSLI